MALVNVQFFSEVLGVCTQMNVILPESRKGQIGVGGVNDEQKWKVLYLLHGLSDDQTIWERRTSIERYVADLPLAVLMPTTQRGWYTDARRGYKWFTYMTEELPVAVHSFFANLSDKREDTFVSGLSMGGYGALKLALSKPEKYGWAASLSGAVDIAEICENRAAATTEFEDIFGKADQVRGSKDDLFFLASELKKSGRPVPNLYMCCGLQDGLYWQNVRLRNHLNSLDMRVTFEEEAGDHRWEYWDMKIQNVLKWLPLGAQK